MTTPRLAAATSVLLASEAPAPPAARAFAAGSKDSVYAVACGHTFHLASLCCNCAFKQRKRGCGQAQVVESCSIVQWRLMEQVGSSRGLVIDGNNW